jgi:hypothetical protein
VTHFTVLVFHHFQADPMFARFHYSIRPKAIFIISFLDNLGRDAVAFSAKLENVVLKPTTVPMRSDK